MSRTALLVLALLALACRGPRPEAAGGSCTHLQAQRELRGSALCEDVWTCTRPPGGRFDRVGLRRLARCEGATGPVVLYLPGMHMNAELPVTDPRHDLRLALADAGGRAWGLDYRTHAVPATAAPAELRTLAAWTDEVFADDAAWAVSFVRGTDPGPLHLAGFSQGAALAYRLAARPGVAPAGLLVLDGALPGAAPSRGDGPAIDVGGSRLPFADRQRLLGTVLADPGAPSPLAGYATAGEALADILYSAPAFGGQGGLSAARDGVSDVRTLAALLRSYDRWWPRAALGGPAPAAPAEPMRVLAFASTRRGATWVARVRDAAQRFGGAQALVRELPGYGHLDVLVARNAARDVFEPALAWLERRRP
jgi:pimeloyl-ACP methyl ester carboxylesterase